jgi:hypothetical protein
MLSFSATGTAGEVVSKEESDLYALLLLFLHLMSTFRDRRFSDSEAIEAIENIERQF